MVIPCVRLRFWKMLMISALVRESSCAGGFVRQEDLRFVHQRAGDGHPLLLTAGELRREIALAIGKTDRGQGSPGPFIGVRDVAAL